MSKKFLLTALTLSALLITAACAGSGELPNQIPLNAEGEEMVYPPGNLIISFDYEKQSGWASNQFAVWIEDMDGNVMKTLYATRYTANGSYERRPELLSEWVSRAGIAEKEKSEIDALTSATPKEGTYSFTWQIIGEDDETFPLGEYRFFVEGNLRWNNRVLYSGIIDTSGDEITVYADAEYFYAECDNHEALTDDSPENAMLSNVTAQFIPAN